MTTWSDPKHHRSELAYFASRRMIDAYCEVMSVFGADRVPKGREAELVFSALVGRDPIVLAYDKLFPDDPNAEVGCSTCWDNIRKQDRDYFEKMLRKQLE